MPTTDLEKLRVSLRRLNRGDLLIIAERATELVPRAKLGTLVGDLIRLEDFAAGKAGAKPVLNEVRKFHEAALGGVYYDSFDVNSRNFMAKSEGTEEFIAEFERLLAKCIRAMKGPRAPLREAFDLLFALLRRIDSDPDSVVFFADEAGSWQVGVDWRAALAAYFHCLADGTAAGESFPAAAPPGGPDAGQEEVRRQLPRKRSTSSRRCSETGTPTTTTACRCAVEHAGAAHQSSEDTWR